MKFFFFASFLIFATPICAEEIRYINLPEKADDAAKVCAFVLNSVSTSRTLTIPKRQENRLIVDLDAYNISPETWDKHLGKEPNMQTFLEVLTAPIYYDFLKVKSLKDFRKTVGAIEEKDRLKDGIIRGIKTTGKVARRDTLITREPTLTGFLWSSVEISNVEIGSDFADKQFKYLATLPNGLLAWAIADSKGNLLNHEDARVSIDKTKKDVRVFAASSCIRCHVNGVEKFDCMVRKIGVKDFHGEIGFDADLSFEKDQKEHVKVVQLLTGLKPPHLAKLVAKFTIKED